MNKDRIQEQIAEKRAKLDALKRTREARENQFNVNKADPSEIVSPTAPKSTELRRQEIDDIVEKLVGGSIGRARGSKAGSVIASQAGDAQSETTSPTRAGHEFPSLSLQTLSTAPLQIVYDAPPSPVREIVTYSKEVQTVEDWTSQEETNESENRRLSKFNDEELREQLRKEIEDDLKLIQQNAQTDGQLTAGVGGTGSIFARELTDEEKAAITKSEEFVDFIERSSKVVERALDLDMEYDILADYGQGVDEDEDTQSGRRIKEVARFYDERWSKKRMISDLHFSPKFPELVLASYTKNPSAPHDPDGLVQVWNMHLHDRPEYVFHAQSDVLTARFSPFHPNLIVGGAYSGQVLLWDTRAKSQPVLRTPLTGSGHTHPVYSVAIVGTQNANNILSCSTDGVVCSWTVDMLAQPQELLELTAPPPSRSDDLAPTCIAFPHSDPTYFLVGTEEGTVYPCHRYDRAGAKAGVEPRVSYRGHHAPVMSLDFHPVRGPVDLGDLVLSSSLDWSVKLWKARPPASAAATAAAAAAAAISPHHHQQATQLTAPSLGTTSSSSASTSTPISLSQASTASSSIAHPILEFSREDVVYDAKWNPIKPGMFALVDGAGQLEVWDITVDTEVPLCKATPSTRVGAAQVHKSLNKLAWEEHEGKKVAVGGLDGMVTVFEVAVDQVRSEEWSAVKRIIGRAEAGGKR
ncbi:WD40-repeat-containing domain protein [Peziza echinospora]|nr:WD40-repeat-containing domain protein [Peziza echinospora]